MNSINSDCINTLYYKLCQNAVGADLPYETSRVGPVKNLGPFCFSLKGNCDRFIFLNKRKFNPVLAIVEACWILAGRNDVASLESVVKDFRKYSDDGTTLNGAYGHRLRKYFGFDQLDEAVHQLSEQPTTRRVCLTLFSPDDLGRESSDIPCNTSVYLKIHDRQLDMSVCNRSNDLFLGVPYNLFAFRLLQIYVSERLSINPGHQLHFTNSLHFYERDFSRIMEVVSTNTISGIEGVAKSIGNIDLINVVKNYSYIVDNKWDLIDYAGLKVPLSAYKAVKSDEKSTHEGLVYNSLLFSIHQWSRKAANYLNISAFSEMERRLKMATSIDTFRSYKFFSKESLEGKVIEIAKNNIDKVDAIKGLVFGRNGSIITADIKDEQQFMMFVVISLLYSSSDIESTHEPFGCEFRKNLKEITEKLQLRAPIMIFDYDKVEKLCEALTP